MLWLTAEHAWQVARQQQAAATAAPAKPRELSEGEKARLADMRARRLADLVPKQCLAVLKTVQAHPVRLPSSTFSGTFPLSRQLHPCSVFLPS